MTASCCLRSLKKGENCDGMDFRMGVAATLPELSEWTISQFQFKLDHPSGGFTRSYCPGGRVFAQLSLPVGGLLNWRNFLQF